MGVYRKFSLGLAIFLTFYLTIQFNLIALNEIQLPPHDVFQSNQRFEDLRNESSSTKTTPAVAEDLTDLIPTTPLERKRRPTPKKLIMGQFQQINCLTTNCSQRLSGKLGESISRVPVTALASPWRSGNTWVRHLLQMSTGIGTSAVYCDNELKTHGFPYECAHNQSRNVLVVKTHQPNLMQPFVRINRHPHFQRAVLILRDPYNFLVANNHKGHLDSVGEDTFFTENSTWKKAQPQLLEWGDAINDYWLNEFSGPVYPLLYSKLVLDTELELRKLLDFLDVLYTDYDIKCAINNKEGRFHRSSYKWTRIKDIEELFSNTIKTKIDSSVKLWAEHLKTNHNIAWEDENHLVKYQD